MSLIQGMGAPGGDRLLVSCWRGAGTSVGEARCPGVRWGPEEPAWGGWLGLRPKGHRGVHPAAPVCSLPRSQSPPATLPGGRWSPVTPATQPRTLPGRELLVVAQPESPEPVSVLDTLSQPHWVAARARASPPAQAAPCLTAPAEPCAPGTAGGTPWVCGHAPQEPRSQHPALLAAGPSRPKEAEVPLWWP